MSSELGAPSSLVSTALVVVSVVFPSLSLLAIYLRFKARGAARANIQADDWWIAVSWILAVPLSINAWVFGSITGIDHYKIDFMKGTTYSLQCIFISSLLIQPALMSVKIAILLFYKRIFGTAYYHFGIAVWVAITVVSIWGILFFLLVLFMSNPISASWTGQGVFRYDVVATGVAQVASSVALDFIVLCFPLPVISTLRIPAKKKIAVMFIFWLGMFCCVAAIARTVLLKRSIREVAESRSSVYTQSTQFVFMILEPHCSIIAACLPCFGPLMRGGVAPEWMIRSARSFMSLASRISSGSRTGSVSQKTTGGGVVGGASELGDSSQVELGKPMAWPDAHHDVAITPGNELDGDTHHHAGDVGDKGAYQMHPLPTKSGLNATRSVDGDAAYGVQRQTRGGKINVTRGVNVTSISRP